ncbi:hypothetical protein LEN26_016510 [Aphanomyces euteiches]|nr:hypothetical protein LEN26_016510 [Aphanomyces euteiches]KAH9116334.1 hypothetical protein AeMF1_009759 [Aphanomyces euteiches]KAH9196575.1 hypothetical protein AeNC1_001435 [Aphanomyces euteiches]
MSAPGGGEVREKKPVAPTKWKQAAKAKGGVKKDKAPMPCLEEDDTEDDVASSPSHSTTNAPNDDDGASESPSSDDEESSSESEEEEETSYKTGGYHRVQVGDVFNQRFTVLEKLGWGHFSTVWRCRDAETGNQVAMKVQKSASHYMEAARDEVELLECVNKAASRTGIAPRIVKLIASFEHTGPHGVHMCMVFEMLGDNLLTLIKRYDYKGIPLPLLKIITKQMLEGMAFLHDECEIIHTDLKPENVLLEAPLMKMPKFRSLRAQKELSPDEKKKLKKKLKKKKQKQNKKEQDDVVNQMEALQITTDEPSDPQLWSNFGSGVESVSMETSLPPLTEYLVNARESRGCPTPHEYAARIMLWLPEDEIVASFGSMRRIFRIKMALTKAMATPVKNSRHATCFSLKNYNFDAFSLVKRLHHELLGQVDEGTSSNTTVWRLEFDARYLGGICQFLETAWPRLRFLNIARSVPYVIQGFHLPIDPPLPEYLLQGIYLPADEELEARVLPVQNRVDSWQEQILARLNAENDAIPDYQVRIADLGNACWTYKHFTQDIQTRQYRSPEVILGQNYDQSTDMWSMGCFVFELATGELLFDPKSGKSYSRDEDHLAQMIELLGRIPKNFAKSGKYSNDYFNSRGELRKIHNLKFWGLKDVLVEKYEFDTDEAEQFAAFLEPMLRFQPSKRATAEESLHHPWLNTS